MTEVKDRAARAGSDRGLVNNWRDAVAIYTQPSVLAMLPLGIAAGLPYLMVFSTLSAWLRDYGVSRTDIGFFAWAGMCFSIKVLWAPIVDRIGIPGLTRSLGQRRSWMLLAQLSIAVGLLAMSLTGPGQSLAILALCSVWVAFWSATQDISLDAYRIESAPKAMQGALSAAYIFGYRLALLISGAGALYIAEYANWSWAYIAIAVLMLVGAITTLLVPEPEREVAPLGGNWVSEAVVQPFTEFFRRNGYWAWTLLALIACYRLSDITMGIMANPFYLDMGYTKAQIATVGKVYGFAMTLLGAALGGILVVRLGVMRPLLIGAVAVAITNLLFAGLAQLPPTELGLIVVISADNLGAGIATSAFIAYLSSLTNQAYTATQYALFSSLMTLPGKFVSGFSGVVVDSYGYVSFFSYTALAGLPAIGLVIWVLMHERHKQRVVDDMAT